jgi:membrane protease YdiL (CAAX protease family)
MSISPTVVEYRLAEWPEHARDALRVQLGAARVPYEWQGTSVLVADDRREQIDAAIARLEPPPVLVGPGPRAGWYVDPLGQQSWRWWDGHRWLRDAGGGVAVRERAWAPAPDDHAHGVRGGVVAFVGFLVSIGLGLGCALAATAFGASTGSLVTTCVGQAGLWTGMFGTCLVVARRNGGGLRGLGLAGVRAIDWGAGAVTSTVMRVTAAVVALVLILVFGLESFRKTTNAPTEGITPSVLAAIVVVAIVCVGAPFFEELFFRGVVQGVLVRRRGARVAIVVQACMFALVHYRVGMTLALTLTTWGQIAVAGFFLGVLRWRYERLGPGMVAHGLFNALAMVVLLATWL